MPWFVYYAEGLEPGDTGMVEFDNPDSASVFIAERLEARFGHVDEHHIEDYRVIHGTKQDLTKEGAVTIRFKEKPEHDDEPVENKFSMRFCPKCCRRPITFKTDDNLFYIECVTCSGDDPYLSTVDHDTMEEAVLDWNHRIETRQTVEEKE